MNLQREHLKNIFLFSELSYQELDLILSSSRRKRYPKGSIVFHEGDPGDALLVIFSGKVKVVLLGEGGQEIILSILGPGSFFGEMAILEAAPRSATVLTLENSEFLSIEQKSFMELLQRHPAIPLKILKHLSTRLRKADDQIRSLAMFDIYGRISQCLFKLGETHGKRLNETLVIQERPSFQELAHMIGCTRETVSRTLKVLQEEGYLIVSRKEIVINRPWPYQM